MRVDNMTYSINEQLTKSRIFMCFYPVTLAVIEQMSITRMYEKMESVARQ